MANRVTIIGPSGNKLTVDPSKAARVTRFDTDGNELQPSVLGSYLVNIFILLGGNVAADVLLWSLFNPSATVDIQVRAIRATCFFSGTAGGTSQRGFYANRSNIVAPTGGTVITPTKKRTGDATSVADLRFDNAALTVTGGNARFGIPLIRWVQPISFTSPGEETHEHDLRMYVPGQRQIAPLVLAYNEGLGIYLHSAAGAGVGLFGYVEWDEVTHVS